MLLVIATTAIMKMNIKTWWKIYIVKMFVPFCMHVNALNAYHGFLARNKFIKITPLQHANV